MVNCLFGGGGRGNGSIIKGERNISVHGGTHDVFPDN